MSTLGFRVVSTEKSPFDGIGKSDEVVLTGIADDSPDLQRKAAATSNLSEVTETFAVFIAQRTTTREAIEGAPLVSREELRRLADPEDLLAILRERRGKRR
jgi:predicted transcriptional regulator